LHLDFRYWLNTSTTKEFLKSDLLFRIILSAKFKVAKESTITPHFEKHRPARFYTFVFCFVEGFMLCLCYLYLVKYTGVHIRLCLCRLTVTWQVSHMEQELLILPEHLHSPQLCFHWFSVILFSCQNQPWYEKFEDTKGVIRRRTNITMATRKRTNNDLQNITYWANI
jgi:hypothetical protein